jgi:hypothetical protein
MNKKVIALIIIVSITMVLAAPVLEVVSGNHYGWFVPRMAHGYVTEVKGNQVWLVPYDDGSDVPGHYYTLADGVSLDSSWVPCPVTYQVSWGTIITINPY